VRQVAFVERLIRSKISSLKLKDKMETEQVKIQEEQFCTRLVENLKAVENTGGIGESDCLAELRKLTGGKLLRGELEAKYPLGKTLSMRISSQGGLFKKAVRPVVLMGKVIVRLDRLVANGGDDEPVSLSELNAALNRESDLANRGNYELFLGLYSPTGWAEEAAAYIRNDPPGSGCAASVLHPILIGPQITELARDRNDSRIDGYIPCFCGLTLSERKQVCRDAINKAILVQEFANLEKIATENRLTMDFVRQIAKKIAAEQAGLVIKNIPGVGWVIKQNI